MDVQSAKVLLSILSSGLEQILMDSLIESPLIHTDETSVNVGKIIEMLALFNLYNTPDIIRDIWKSWA